MKVFFYHKPLYECNKAVAVSETVQRAFVTDIQAIQDQERKQTSLI